MHIHEYAKYLKRVLKEELPGEPAQKIMAPLKDLNKRFVANFASARKSAVLILLYPEGRDVKILLIRRAKDGSPHSGQISLPGGKWEPHDKSLCETALREAEEEVGSKRHSNMLLGNLSHLFIPVSNFIVLPVVAMAAQRPAFSANPDEVAGLIPIPLHELLVPDNRITHKFNVRNSIIEAPCFQVEGYRIWGATAMILSEFAEILRGLQVDREKKEV